MLLHQAFYATVQLAVFKKKSGGHKYMKQLLLLSL